MKTINFVVSIILLIAIPGFYPLLKVINPIKQYDEKALSELFFPAFEKLHCKRGNTPHA
jgi:hypothetical protein